MPAANNLVATVVIGLIALILGFPVAIAAISYERAYVPNVVLGSKTIDTGLGRTSTLTFTLLTGPNDVVTAAAFISIISSLLVLTGFILIRHVTRHNVWGWLVFGPSILNVLGQIACCTAAYIFQGKYPAVTSASDIQYMDGTYNTNGKLYTKEQWSCALNTFYAAQNGAWADKACSDFKTGRMLTIPLIVCSLFLFGIAFWQVQLRGGLGWLFGQREKVTAAYRPKGDYIDLQE